MGEENILLLGPVCNCAMKVNVPMAFSRGWKDVVICLPLIERAQGVNLVHESPFFNMDVLCFLQINGEWLR